MYKVWYIVGLNIFLPVISVLSHIHIRQINKDIFALLTNQERQDKSF